MPIPVDQRPLNSAEHALLERILVVNYPGVAQLRAQLCRVRVVALWSRGSVSVDFRVFSDAPRSDLASGVIPVDAAVVTSNGQLVGEILIWVEIGYLSALEYAWYGDEMPASLPNPENIVVTVHEA
ncbi:hypothetical protein [Frankia sp. Cas4]|uniref:hypothetical protein n=1 Tax=Frankia sp. Cas4 TaxID=3073927 RepID=UPI002AD2CD9C|nr:hypothetical protein [Frankia sp. Cas4]